jgi:hypothetical protein
VTRAPVRSNSPIRIAALAAACLLVAAATLTPVPGANPNATTPPFCVLCGELASVDILWNIALFVPFGAALATAGVRARRSLLIVFATTLSIELLQMRLIAGRDASLRDLLANVTGGMCGWMVVAHWRALVHPAPRPAVRLATAWSVALAVATFLQAWSLSSSFTWKPWWSQRALLSRDGFRGEVLAAGIGPLRVPVDSLSDSASTRYEREFRAGQSATVIMRTAAPSAKPVRVFQLADRYGRDLISLSQDGRDVLFYVRTRASDLRLRSPHFRLADAFPAQPGVIVHTSGWLTDGMVRVSVTGGGREVSDVRRLSSQWGWVFIAPRAISVSRAASTFTGLWVALLALPLGYWCSSAAAGERPSRARATLVAALVVVSVLILVALPVSAGLLPSGIPEWAGWVAGLAGGGAAHAVLRGAMAHRPAGEKDAPITL